MRANSTISKPSRPKTITANSPASLVLGRQVPEQTALRLRALLIERFHLKAHIETKDHTVYDLTVAKGGPGMKPGDPATHCVGGLRRQSGSFDFESTSCTMPWFADRLARFAFQTGVFDKTGLTGIYDFNIDFAPTGAYAPAMPSDAGLSSAPSLFTALQSLGSSSSRAKRRCR